MVPEGEPNGWYCYTSMSFVKGRVILSYCAGDKKVGGLSRLKVLAILQDWVCADEMAGDLLSIRPKRVPGK